MSPAPVTDACFVYILRCADGSYYVGATTDLSARERAHNDGFGSDFTSTRRPVRMVYSEALDSWAAARRREMQIKHWSRAKKRALIEGNLEQVLARRRDAMPMPSLW